MTIKTSGSLSLQEINAEFGLGTNLNSYRGVKWWLDNNTTGNFPTGQITFNDFYSKRKDSPVVPGTATYSSPGTFTFTIPLHNTLIVKVYGAGGEGGSQVSPSGIAGGASWWDGGSASGKPQANGGGGGGVGVSGSPGFGGTASNGDINLTGSQGQVGGTGTSAVVLGYGGAGAKDGFGKGGDGAYWTATFARRAAGGGGGGYSEKTYSSGVYAPGVNINVNVGSGGTGGGSGASGQVGRVVISWF